MSVSTPFAVQPLFPSLLRVQDPSGHSCLRIRDRFSASPAPECPITVVLIELLCQSEAAPKSSTNWRWRWNMVGERPRTRPSLTVISHAEEAPTASTWVASWVAWRVQLQHLVCAHLQVRMLLVHSHLMNAVSTKTDTHDACSLRATCAMGMSQRCPSKGGSRRIFPRMMYLLSLPRSPALACVASLDPACGARGRERADIRMRDKNQPVADSHWSGSHSWRLRGQRMHAKWFMHTSVRFLFPLLSA